MRVTSSAFYNNIYGENNKINRQLFDVNKQISSGMKIQYSHENPGVFIDTLRLDDEITTFTQVKKSAQEAFKYSTQTDSTIGEIVKTLESMKTKLINAASDVNDVNSMNAIAKELRGLKNHLTTLGNTSIAGQYLFSGTAVSQKPIDENGEYQGNSSDLQTFLGAGIKQKFNISGTQLFLGNESNIPRTITTNTPQKSLTDLYPDIMSNANTVRSDSKETFITSEHTIRDLMGDTDVDSTNDSLRKSYFYIQGTRSSGETFKQKITMPMDAKVGDLLAKISDAFGPNQVDVTLSHNGQIQIEDKKSGSSKLDFHIVGVVDFGSDGIDAADTTDLATLQSGTTNFDNVISGSNPLYIKEFIRSSFTSSNPSSTIEGLQYDQFNFSKNGAKLGSNVPQIVKGTNEYATASNKLIDVSGMESVNGRLMSLKGVDINGANYDIRITLGTPSSFTDNVTGNTYSIFGSAFDDSVGAQAGKKEINEGIASNADEITYQQLMDIVNMAVTGSLPTVPLPGNDPVDYDKAIENANTKGKVTLSTTGKLEFTDLTSPVTRADIALYDTTTSSFFPPLITGNALSFQANNSLTIRDPKNDFFAQIEEIIKSVEENKKYPDGNDNRNPRNIGVQNAIQKIDDLTNHVSRLQSESGSYSQVLQATSDRTDLLIISTTRLRSDVIDTDVAEATLKLQQLSMNYQALFSGISKVSKLSLVNYL